MYCESPMQKLTTEKRAIHNDCETSLNFANKDDKMYLSSTDKITFSWSVLTGRMGY